MVLNIFSLRIEIKVKKLPQDYIVSRNEESKLIEQSRDLYLQEVHRNHL